MKDLRSCYHWKRYYYCYMNLFEIPTYGKKVLFQPILLYALQEIPGGGSLRNALSEMKNMIYTPLKRFEPVPGPQASTPNPAPGPVSAAKEIQKGDIPGQFTKVMGKGDSYK